MSNQTKNQRGDSKEVKSEIFTLMKLARKFSSRGFGFFMMLLLCIYNIGVMYNSFVFLELYPGIKGQVFAFIVSVAVGGGLTFFVLRDEKNNSYSKGAILALTIFEIFIGVLSYSDKTIFSVWGTDEFNIVKAMITILIAVMCPIILKYYSKAVNVSQRIEGEAHKLSASDRLSLHTEIDDKIKDALDGYVLDYETLKQENEVLKDSLESVKDELDTTKAELFELSESHDNVDTHFTTLTDDVKTYIENINSQLVKLGDIENILSQNKTELEDLAIEIATEQMQTVQDVIKTSNKLAKNKLNAAAEKVEKDIKRRSKTLLESISLQASTKAEDKALNGLKEYISEVIDGDALISIISDKMNEIDITGAQLGGLKKSINSLNKKIKKAIMKGDDIILSYNDPKDGDVEVSFNVKDNN